MTRTILMVAYHFPPLAGSSGIQRTLRFVQQLPAFGWNPVVLTAHPRAYERTSEDLLADVPAGVEVVRAAAWDTARHLSLGGRYIGAMARPDRWMSWRFDGVRKGLDLIRRHRPAAIWSTYPIATAHVIGAALQHRTNLPWIADFRDPMAQEGYPADPLTWQAYRRIEENALLNAAASVFTTPGAAAEYRRRYPSGADRIRVIENGYDEETFERSGQLQASGPLVPGALTLLHSGVVYPSERDPTQLMQALAQLHALGAITPQRLRIRFRAAVADGLLRELAAAHGVTEYIELAPAVPYREALAEMLRADGLLLMQASNCNAQIPAKIYEYLRAGRPIVGLTDATGDTAGALRAAGVSENADLARPDEIAALLARFMQDPGSAALRPAPDRVALASRRHRASELAALFDTLLPAAGR